MSRGCARPLPALLAVMLIAMTLQVWGQTFPSRPVTMIVSYAAGGSAEVAGRLLGAEMAKVLGQNVVIELKPCAGLIFATPAVMLARIESEYGRFGQAVKLAGLTIQ